MCHSLASVEHVVGADGRASCAPVPCPHSLQCVSVAISDLDQNGECPCTHTHVQTRSSVGSTTGHWGGYGCLRTRALVAPAPAIGSPAAQCSPRCACSHRPRTCFPPLRALHSGPGVHRPGGAPLPAADLRHDRRRPVAHHLHRQRRHEVRRRRRQRRRRGACARARSRCSHAPPGRKATRRGPAPVAALRRVHTACCVPCKHAACAGAARAADRVGVRVRTGGL